MSASNTSQHSELIGRTVSASEEALWDYPMRLEIPEVFSANASPLPIGVTSAVAFRVSDGGPFDNERISSRSKAGGQKVQSSFIDNKGHLFPLTPLPESDYPAPAKVENHYPPNQFPDSDFPADAFPLNSYPQMSYPLTGLPQVNFPASEFPEQSFPKSGIYPRS